MNVSRETMAMQKYPHQIQKHDIVCIGEREVLVIDVEPEDAIVTHMSGSTPIRIGLVPHLTYTVIPKEDI